MNARKFYIGSLLIVFLAVLISLSAVDASSSSGFNPNAIFYEANSLYANNEFGAAAQKYEQLIRLGYQSGNVYFNLGNAYYKSGQKGLAVLYYEKAHRLMPWDADVNANRSYAGIQNGWDRGMTGLGYIFTLDQALVHASVWFFLLIFFGIAMIMWPVKFRNEPGTRLKTWSRISLIVVIVLFGISLWIAGLTFFNQSQPMAVVIDRESPVRFEPNPRGTEYYRLSEGAIIKILDKKDGWLLIQRPDHKRGWIRESEVGVI